MEWLKTQLALAKSGERSARKKLIVTAVLFVTLLVLVFSGQNQSQPIEVQTKPAKSTISISAGYVHISGEVNKPGVYAVDSQTRLFEVIALAGGFTKKADQSSINLARVLEDGEQILVAQKGENVETDDLLHLNRASAAELDALPGIGPTLSKRIIDWRDTNGPFHNVEDLKNIAGIGDRLFAGIRTMVAP